MATKKSFLCHTVRFIRSSKQKAILKLDEGAPIMSQGKAVVYIMKEKRSFFQKNLLAKYSEKLRKDLKVNNFKN